MGSVHHRAQISKGTRPAVVGQFKSATDPFLESVFFKIEPIILTPRVTIQHLRETPRASHWRALVEQGSDINPEKEGARPFNVSRPH